MDIQTGDRPDIPPQPPSVRSRVLIGTVCIATILAASGCKDESPEDCVSTRDYFEQEVWARTLSSNCIGCHTSAGAAKESQFILVSPEERTDYIDANLATFANLSRLEYDGVSVLLLKPLGKNEHGGGKRFEKTSEEYKAFDEMLGQLADPVVCADDGESTAFFEGLETRDNVSTLRKASLSLVGRLPTAEESMRVEFGGPDALDSVLEDMMHEPEFYTRLKEIYNDRILTDRYVPRTDALDLLNDERYPNRYWFDEIPDDSQRDIAARRSNIAVAREALELIAYVVREDLPFTEILTADYLVFNPYSAQSYGISIAFDDDQDPDEFRPGNRASGPHSGLLTSHMFLNRFPTTATNRNRHRARMILDIFLGTDILKLGSRPIDASSIKEFNPTVHSSACNVCHQVMDPIAGTMQNWNDAGQYAPPESGWHGDMLKPGFGDADLPYAKKEEAAAWLGQQIVADGRFPSAVVRFMITALTGHAPLADPKDPEAKEYVAQAAAVKAQNKVLGDIADGFVESGYDLRYVIKEVVKSPYYRASNIEQNVSNDKKTLELSLLGSPHFLTPEQLHRKIEAVTGYPWQNRNDARGYLLDFNEYRVFYGGIDSDTIIDRITEPNGIMANTAERMANEMACWTTARDFVLPAASRRLFPYVSPQHEPVDVNGFEIPAAADSIRANIRYLHQRVLGERLKHNDPEIDRTFGLFLEVWRDGKRGIADEIYENRLARNCSARSDFWTGDAFPEEEQINRDPNYTIRAWMAVMSYLLTDYKFLYE
ncbi:MAG: hypothetical protein V3V08_22440 [Nannocystaceae bacterium]